MLISQGFFEQLCPSYQDAIKNFEQQLDECNGDVEKRQQIMLEFSSNYLMPIPYWSDILGEATSSGDETLLNMLATKAHKHLHVFLLPPKDNATPMHRLLMLLFSEQHESSEFLPDANDVCYPHQHLSGCLYELETAINRALPKQLLKIYDVNKELYQKIKAAEENVGEWFRLVTQFGDESKNDQFVRLMIEYRLGRNLLDIRLWKLYIDYLREKNPQEMLKLYSKYCRFHADDLEMKEKYKMEVEKYGPVFVEWENLFEFETPMSVEDEVVVEEEEKEDDDDDETLFEVNLADGVYGVKRKDILPNQLGFGISFRKNRLKRIRSLDGDRRDEQDVEDDDHLSRDSEFDNPPSRDSGNNNSPSLNDENFNAPDPEADAPLSSNSEDDDGPPPPKLFRFFNEHLKKELPPISPEILQLSKTFYHNIQPQSLPFQAPLTKYILDAASPSILQKLHHSCKYFFTRKPTPICYKLEAQTRTFFSVDSLKFTIRQRSEEELLQFCDTELCKNLWITTAFIDNYVIKKKYFHEIIANIYKCDAKYIHIRCCLTPKEIKILLQSGNVVVFKWNYAYRLEDPYAPKMEEITQYLPKIEELHITPVTITSTTVKALLKQSFASKFFSLNLCCIKGEPFDIDGFLKFCIDNRAVNFKMMVSFNPSFGNQPFLTEFEETMMRYESVTEMTKFDIFLSSPF